MHRTTRSLLILASASMLAGIPAIPHVSAAASPAFRQACGHAAYACNLWLPSTLRPDITGPPPGALDPSQLQSAYGLTAAASTDGSGQRVYVTVAYNDPTIASDLAAYRSQYSLSDCTEASGCLQVLNDAGKSSPLPASEPAGIYWNTTAAIEADMVSAICPNCGITILEAPDDSGNGLLDETKEAAILGAKFVVIPWGSSSTGDSTATLETMDSTYLKPSGVVYTSSNGDSGYADGPFWPADSPAVVSVGGTALTTDSGARGWKETVWSSSDSGCETHETEPAWQTTVVPSSACMGRAVNDVSAVASPSTAPAFYSTDAGGWLPVGGEEIAAGIIAATFALAGTPAPTEHPAQLLYENAADLNDVTSGNDGACGNILCTGAAGWDGPTGNGTPNGLAAFVPPPSEASAIAIGKSTTVAFGHKVVIKTTLTDAKTKAAIGSASIKLLAKPAGSKSFVTAKTMQTAASGSASVSVDPVYNTQFKWEYDGAGVHDPITSKVQTVNVEALTDLVATKKVAAGKSIKIALVVRPGQHGQKVTLQRKVGKSWRTVTVAKLTTSTKSHGAVGWEHVFKTKESKAGSYQFRALVAKTSRNVATTSKPVTVKVS